MTCPTFSNMAPESKADQWSFPGVCGHSAIFGDNIQNQEMPESFFQNISPPVSFELSTSRKVVVSSWEFRVSPVTFPGWRRSCRLENSPDGSGRRSLVAPVTCLLQLIVKHKRTFVLIEKKPALLNWNIHVFHVLWPIFPSWYLKLFYG